MGSFDTNEVLPKQIVNETPSTGTNNSFATRSDVYKEDEDDKFWNTEITKLSPLDSAKINYESVVEGQDNVIDIE